MATYRSTEAPRLLETSPNVEATAGETTEGSPVDATPLILNVDAHEAARTDRTILLNASGYRVVEAQSAAEAIRVMLRHTISLALVDVQLPDSDAIELCGTLKRLRENVPVVLVSATGSAAEAREAGRAGGAHDVLEGPIEGASLLRCIEGVLTGPARHWDSEIEVVTDRSGLIVDASPAGARLLNGTVRGVLRRNLLVYFEQHRETWRTALVRALAGEPMSLAGRLRPKDRRPVRVQVRIERVVADGWAAIRWTFHSSDSRTAG
jgi:DNA-binding response OmpR family regulator